MFVHMSKEENVWDFIYCAMGYYVKMADKNWCIIYYCGKLKAALLASVFISCMKQWPR